MADSLIIKGTDMNVSSLKIMEPRLNKGGKGKTARIASATGSSLYFSAPLMMTWGVNEYIDDNTGVHKYSVALQFPQEQYANENQRRFLDNMKEFEERILDEAVKNSKKWLNGKKTLEVVKALWTPILKYPKDKETDEIDYSKSPTMKLNLSYWDEKFSVELYDLQRKELFKPEEQDTDGYPSPVNIISKNSHIAGVIQCNGIWFSGGKFGVKFTLVQAIVRQPVRIQGACHVALDAVDLEAVEEADRKEEEASANDGAGSDVGSDAGSDVEQVDQEEQPDEEVAEIVDDEPEPEPEPVKTKKVGKKISKKISKKSS